MSAVGVTPKNMITGSVLTPSKSTLEESKTPSGHMHRHTVMGTTAERIFGVGGNVQHSAAKHMSTNLLNTSHTHLMGANP